MSIYTNGYAISGTTAGQIAELIESTAAADEPVVLTDFEEGRLYNEWMGREAELKGFEKGIYLETEYKLRDAHLMQLSLRCKGVISLFWYGNMGGYGCSYYLDGKKILERLTVLGINMKDEDMGREFTGHATQQVIETLFQQLTGATLGEAVKTKGTMYEFKKNITEL
jgi:hypothetical protein